MANGGDPNILGKSRITPLYVAVKNERINCVEMLINTFKANVNLSPKYKSGVTLLHIAVYNENLEIIKMLIDAGVDINARNSEGQTALFSACIDRNLDIIKMLLDAGVDINATDSEGQTALVRACIEHKDYLKDLKEVKFEWELERVQNSVDRSQKCIDMLVIAMAKTLST